MDDRHSASPRSAVSRIHPWAYKVIAALAILFVLAAWGFDGTSYTGYLLAVVSGLFLIAVALPWMLWRSWDRNRRRDPATDQDDRLSSWASGDFETWTGRMKGKTALIEALLPIAAVAIGMVAFVIALHIAV